MGGISPRMYDMAGAGYWQGGMLVTMIDAES